PESAANDPVRRDIVARAPTRIDLGGGWTDVPPYCDREGGFVCNVAIDRYSFVRLDDASETASIGDSTAVPLVRAALRRSGVSDAQVWVARPRRARHCSRRSRPGRTGRGIAPKSPKRVVALKSKTWASPEGDRTIMPRRSVA